MVSWSRGTARFGVSVIVVTFPVIMAPIFDQPLYRVFLYYAIEIVVLMLFASCMTVFASPDQNDYALSPINWSPHTIFKLTITVTILPLFLIGLIWGIVPLLFAAVALGILIAPREPSVTWTLTTKLRFTVGIMPLALLFALAISVSVWQTGVILSSALTGATPSTDGVTWFTYLSDIQLSVLVPALTVIVFGTLQTLYAEVIASEKYQHTTPKELFVEYAKVGIVIPAVIWFVAIGTLLPVFSLVGLAQSVGSGWVAWGGTVTVSAALFFVLGVYILLQSYAHWKRSQAQRAWERGNYADPLLPTEYEVKAPVVGRISLGIRENRNNDT